VADKVVAFIYYCVQNIHSEEIIVKK
jgi:hypothetical protein